MRRTILSILVLAIPIACGESGGPVSVGDPGGGIALQAPSDGDVLSRGDPIGGELHPGISCCTGVEISLARRSGEDCEFWDDEAVRYVEGRCAALRWFEVEVSPSSHEWTYALPVELLPGRYELQVRNPDPELKQIEDPIGPVGFTIE